VVGEGVNVAGTAVIVGVSAADEGELGTGTAVEEGDGRTVGQDRVGEG
jgi:hypothetical protein